MLQKPGWVRYQWKLWRERSQVRSYTNEKSTKSQSAKLLIWNIWHTCKVCLHTKENRYQCASSSSIHHLPRIWPIDYAWFKLPQSYVIGFHLELQILANMQFISIHHHGLVSPLTLMRKTSPNPPQPQISQRCIRMQQGGYPPFSLSSLNLPFFVDLGRSYCNTLASDIFGVTNISFLILACSSMWFDTWLHWWVFHQGWVLI